MSDLFSDEDSNDQATPASSGSQDANYWRTEAEKAFAARDAARNELRTKIESAFDPDVVELVPKNLPPKEWEEYANKLVTFRGQKEAPVTPETSSAEPEPEVEVPDAEKLAGIVNGPSGSASGGSGHVSRAEWTALIQTDPAEAERLFKSEKVDFSDLRQGLGPDR